MQQSRIFVGMVLILIFGEVLGLYGYVYLRLSSPQGRRDGGRMIGGLLTKSSITV